MLPNNVSSFLQESGRAGRDGERAISYSIIQEDEIANCKNKKRKALIDCFREPNSCIRENLLLALGENISFDFECSKDTRDCTCLKSVEKHVNVIERVLSDYSKYLKNSELALLLKGIRLTNIPFSEILPFFGLMRNINISFINEFIENKG